MTVSVKNSLFNSIRENKVTMFISLLNPRYIYIFLPRYKGVAKQHIWSKCSTKTFWVSICCGHVTWVFRNICKTDGFLGFFLGFWLYSVSFVLFLCSCHRFGFGCETSFPTSWSVFRAPRKSLANFLQTWMRWRVNAKLQGGALAGLT